MDGRLLLDDRLARFIQIFHEENQQVSVGGVGCPGRALPYCRLLLQEDHEQTGRAAIHSYFSRY
jgi:hypothetical protein